MPGLIGKRLLIVTPFRQHVGGVEQVNTMLERLFLEEGMIVDYLTTAEVVVRFPQRVQRKFIGLHRSVGKRFDEGFARKADLVICSGEFGYGIRHPKAVALFHGTYLGYARIVRKAKGFRASLAYSILEHDQKAACRGKTVVAVSRTTGDALSRAGVKVDRIIENAVDTDRFIPRRDLPRMSRFLYVGSSDRFRKGIDTLEELAGRGFAIDCVTGAKPRDDRLRWLGSIPNHRLGEIYPRYSALLLPSRLEGCPMVLLEAMACGTPVLTTRVGIGADIEKEIPEFVLGGPEESLAQQFVERIRYLERNWDACSVKARELAVRRFSLPGWKDNWRDLVQRIAGS